MARRLLILLSVLAAHALPAHLQAQATTPAPSLVRAAAIRFAAAPSWRRVHHESFIYLGGDILVTAAISVWDADGRPLAGIPVTLLARDDAGPVALGTGMTGPDGRADVKAPFDLGLQSLEVSVQACVRGMEELCTSVWPLSLRRWLDVEIDVESMFHTRPHLRVPEEIDTPLMRFSDNTFQALVTPLVTVTLWEAARGGSRYAFTAFGSLPLIYANRSTMTLLGAEPAGSDFGVGDYTLGLGLQAPMRVRADIAFNGANGRDSILGGENDPGRPQFVNLGDGLASLDTSVVLSVPASATSIIFFGANTSHAFTRRLGDIDSTGERDGYLRGTVGAVLLIQGNAFGLTPWLSYQHRGATMVRGSAGRTVVSPAAREIVVGLNYADQRSGPLGASVGGYVAGLRAGETTIGLNVRLTFRELLRR